MTDLQARLLGDAVHWAIRRVCICRAARWNRESTFCGARPCHRVHAAEVLRSEAARSQDRHSNDINALRRLFAQDLIDARCDDCCLGLRPQSQSFSYVSSDHAGPMNCIARSITEV
ncbi:hypothetical protein [Xanthomonas citri]|uniref:hypothetical protein n=1 Tax=Xanthomonas citri TaxID=346 RepID=UPI0019809D04|nr:hypothetical protein [Xanthomonas citri]